MKSSTHRSRVWTSLLLALLILINMTAGFARPAAASENPASAVSSEKKPGTLLAEYYGVTDHASSTEARKPISKYDASIDHTQDTILSTVDQFAAAVRKHMVAHEEEFSISLSMSLEDWIYSFSTESLSNLTVLGPTYRKIFAHTGVPYEGDYMYENMNSLYWSAYFTSNSIVITLYPSYQITESQEAAVTSEVKRVLTSLNLDGKTDYEKIEAVYTYMVKNIVYDYTYSRHSAYQAIVEHNVVCQGFSSAFYRFMLELGIDCRCITSEQLNHAWNIVQLEGRYYLVDATWDENYYAYSPSSASDISDRFVFFLRCHANFDHDNYDDQYTLASYQKDYPVSSTDYDRTSLKILTQPKDITGNVDETAKFSVKAGGKGVTYQWYYKLPGASSFTAWSGKTSSTVSFTGALSKNGMQVYCVVKNYTGKTLQSETATYRLSSLPLTIDTQPENVTVNAGATATFRVAASGDQLRYQWYYKMPGASSYTLWSGKTAASVSLSAASSKNGMQLYCMITDAAGISVKSNVVTLTVRNELAITQQPVNVEVKPGETATFRIAASGDGVTYQWYYKMPGDASFTLWSGKTAASFNFVTSLSKDGMKLCCIVKDKYGHSLKSEQIVLTVRTPLSITRQPSNVEVKPGERATFSVAATGDKLTYQWYYKMPGDKSFTLWSGKTASSVSLDATLAKSGMQVCVIVKDSHGSSLKSSPAILTAKTPLTIIEQPVNITAVAGDSILFRIEAEGDKLTYQWYFKMPGDKSFTLWSGKTASSVSVNAAATKNGMQVCCIVKDMHGTTQKSTYATLTVKTPLSITREPADMTVDSGNSILISVGAAGDGLKYQWYFKMPTDSSFILWSGRTASSFNFTPSEAKNGMQVYCLVTDERGNTAASRIATLTVNPGAAKITKQPESIIVAEGGTASFKVTATGSGLTYQWYYKMNGADSFTLWSGKTAASVSTSASKSKNQMQVYCVVKDVYGNTVTSNIVKLFVEY